MNRTENPDRASTIARAKTRFAPWPTLAGLLAVSVLASACRVGALRSLPESPEPCITTHEEDCLSIEEFEDRSTALAEDFRAATDFSNQWGLAAINAGEAYAHLALAEGDDVRPGEGQTIGMIDTGIDREHPLFEGMTLTEEFLQGAENETGDDFSHGTAVGSIIASPRLPRYAGIAHGVAWGADLAVFGIPLGDPPDEFVPITLEVLKRIDTRNAARYEHVLAWRNGERRLDFLNLSFGYTGLIDSYTDTELRDNHGTVLGVLAQADTEEKTILVWAAGNYHGLPCSMDAPWCVEGTDGEREVDASAVGIVPGFPVYFEEMRGHSLAVVAINEDGEITNFSNRCGSASQWCLAAPGEGILGVYYGPSRDGQPGFRGIHPSLRGTSFAAPMVTGGLAVMKHYFRDQLANTDLAARLLETADRTGIYADAAVYGRGLMDLGAATSPVGETEIAMAATVNGGGAPLAGTGLVSGGALGDGLAGSFAGQEIAAFDSLGAPFWFDLGNFASVRDEDAIAMQLRDFMTPDPGLHGLGARPVLSLRKEHGAWVPRHEAPSGLQLGLLDTPAGAEAGHLGLAEHALALSLGGPNGLSATAFSTEGTDGASPSSGAVLSWRAGESPFSLRAGWLGEREALLGTSARGAFGALSADAVFAGINAEAQLGGWRVFGGAELGTVTAEESGGLIADLSPLTTSAFALRVTRPLGTDRGLGLSVSQPLRVESGEATLSVPAGRTKGGDVLRRPVSADLSPTGRQVDVAARWHRRWKDGGELRLGAAWTRDPGHRAATDPSLAVLAGWRQAF